MGGGEDGGQGVQRALVSVQEIVCVCAELPLVAVAARPGTGITGTAGRQGAPWQPHELQAAPGAHKAFARLFWGRRGTIKLLTWASPSPCLAPQPSFGDTSLRMQFKVQQDLFLSAAESECLRPVPAAQASNVQVFFRLCIFTRSTAGR